MGFLNIPPDPVAGGGGGGGGITSINGDSTALQTIGVGIAGTAPAVSTTLGSTTINIPNASTTGVTAGLVSKTDYDLLQNVGDKNARTSRFVSIGAGTGGTITAPTNSTIVLDDFGGTVDAIVAGISGGRPDFTIVKTAGGVTVATTFDGLGNYALSGTPSAYPIAVIYRVRQKLRDFDSTATDIVGDVQFDSGALKALNNLADVQSATTARTNLGLGSSATTASTAYEVAGAASAAQAFAIQRANHTGTQTASTVSDFNTQVATTAALKSNNLSDLASASLARINLGLDKRTTFTNAAYTVLSTDKLVSQIGTMTASRTVTLPLANSVNAGYEIIIADESGTVTVANTIIVSRAGADLIDGVATATIAAAYATRRLFSDGTSKWTFDAGVLRSSNNLSDLASTTTAKSNLGLSAANTRNIGFFFPLTSAVNTTYILSSSASTAGTINSIQKLFTSSGTVTATVQINGTTVTGLGSLSVTSITQSPTASALNTFVVGDVISLVLASNASAADLRGNILVTV